MLSCFLLNVITTLLGAPIPILIHAIMQPGLFVGGRRTILRIPETDDLTQQS